VKYSTFKNKETAERNVKFVSDFSSAYYMRLSVDDTAGVLAKISGVFAKCGISLIEVSQIGHKSELFRVGEDNRVPLVIITHKTTENKINSAVSKINALGIGNVKSLIRVEQ
jgi:homoserine dehydrogenase